MWEESLETQAGVHLIKGVCLIWGPLNTGFTVVQNNVICGKQSQIGGGGGGVEIVLNLVPNTLQ